MDDASALRGDALLHTDINSLNVLINGTACIIDWAWPTRGAAWLEPACFIPRLMAAGHTPADAEVWHSRPLRGARRPEKRLTFSWQRASGYGPKSQADPRPWKKILALMTEQWMRYRRR